jgi:hypothetical protein
MTLPNFLIVGAAKSGTTSLYAYLAQHPDVYLCPVKEPCFFSDGNPRLVRTNLEYEALFDTRTSEKAVGEASASYLYDPEAPKKIKALMNGVKIIIILRNPINRAYSQWGQIFYQLGYEELSFEEALLEEDTRISLGKFNEDSPFYYGFYHYFHVGLYYEQVKRYFDIFYRERVQVHIFEEFIKDPGQTCKEIFSFIGVDPGFIPVIEKHNMAASFRFGFLHKLLLSPPPILSKVYQALPMRSKLFIYDVARSLFRMNLRDMPRPPMEKSIRDRLMARYRENIHQLEGLLGRDLSLWDT